MRIRTASITSNFATLDKPTPKPRTRRSTVSSAARFASNLSPLQSHDQVTKGLSVAAALALLAKFRLMDRQALLRAVGISERTLQRAAAANKALDSNASDRALRLAAVMAQAVDVLGSQDAAEHWLAASAMGLDQRAPIDLLQSSDGTELVKTLLTRMDHGVYA